MEKYVIPPFYYSDFKFPSVNKVILKEVKLIFAQLATATLQSKRRSPACFTFVRRSQRGGAYRFLPFLADAARSVRAR